MEEKSCSVCGIQKPLKDFYKQNRERIDGTKWIYYNPECKDCTKKRSTNWGKENKEAQKQHNIKYKKTKRAKEKRKTVWMKNYVESGKRKEWEENNKNKLSKYSRSKSMNKTHEITIWEWWKCKDYFNNSCAYCGITYEEHIEKHKQDLHKEHVDHKGSNDLSNCVPACKNCNSQKNTYELTEWYDKNNDNYTYERLEKILKWINEDYKQYIKNPL